MVLMSRYPSSTGTQYVNDHNATLPRLLAVHNMLNNLNVPLSPPLAVHNM